MADGGAPTLRWNFDVENRMAEVLDLSGLYFLDSLRSSTALTDIWSLAPAAFGHKQFAAYEVEQRLVICWKLLRSEAIVSVIEMGTDSVVKQE